MFTSDHLFTTIFLAQQCSLFPRSHLPVQCAIKIDCSPVWLQLDRRGGIQARPEATQETQIKSYQIFTCTKEGDVVQAGRQLCPSLCNLTPFDPSL